MAALDAVERVTAATELEGAVALVTGASSGIAVRAVFTSDTPAAADPYRMDEITESLARAFDRLADFEAVQAGASGRELVDAVVLLARSVGIGDAARAVVRERLGHLDPASHARGHVLFGLIVGLTAAELGRDPAAAHRA